MPNIEGVKFYTPSIITGEEGSDFTPLITLNNNHMNNMIVTTIQLGVS